MTVRRVGNFDAFPGAEIERFRLFCLYGENDALIRERIKALRLALSQPEPPETLDIEGDDLAREPFRLADEIGSVSLFASQRLLRVRLGTRTSVEAFEHALPALERTPDVTLAVEGGDDKRQEDTIAFLSETPTALVVRCDHDRPDDLADHARRILAEAGIAVDADVARELVGLVDGDRAFLANELAKLVLLVPRGAALDRATLRAAVADEESAVLDDMVRQIFDGDVGGLVASVDRMASAGGDAAQLAGAALRSALWSHRSLVEGARGGRVGPGDLRRMIGRLADVVQASRSSDPLARVQAERLVIRMAQFLRRQAR
jgi:DNA polymerase-3 subunit delta